MSPAFSIILSTWNRGRHIVPTIKSVLQQTFTDYELLIIGDCCSDETEAAVRPFLSERVRWRNLPERFGNQYGPNNAGIEMARGRYIAYLGHDDLWSPHHLEALHGAFLRNPDASFVMSGCVCYGPPGSGYHHIIAMFDDGLPLDQFYPPSSIAHTRGAIDATGPWREPETIRATTDADLLLRAKEAGLHFAATRQITAHKVPGGVRYLLYARQQSDEQDVLLRMMAERGFDDFVAAVVATARTTDTHLGVKFPRFDDLEPGAIHHMLSVTRGVDLPPLVELVGKAVMPQDDGHRLYDWRKPTGTGRARIRWSGRNPRPRLLLPFSAAEPVRLRFAIHDTSEPDVLDQLRLVMNGVETPWQFQRRDQSGRRAVIECRAVLPAERHSVLMFDLTGGLPLEDLTRCVEGRSERIALGEVRLQPARGRPGWRDRLVRLIGLGRLAQPRSLLGSRGA